MSRFSYSSTPLLKRSRSRFDLSHGVKTSGNVGYLYPFDIQEVLPGDTFKVRTACVSRLASQFVRPVMDNLFMDTYYFYVPSRLLYDKWVNIFGENTESAWANSSEYEVPSVSGTVVSKTVGDYLGLPVGVPLKNISPLPFRAFAKIYDDWFRDQNNIDPMHVQTGEIVASESFNSNDWSPRNYFGKPPRVAKFHDIFTSCLPQPQKGTPVDIPLGNFQDVPVVTDVTRVPSNGIQLVMQSIGNSNLPSHGVLSLLQSATPTYGGVTVEPSSSSGAPLSVSPANLWAQTSDLTSPGFTVNDLRFAFQYQKMLERDARSGTRYTSYLLSSFGVSAGDSRLQRSEFLGGRRTPISISQVVQTTGADDDTSPLGQVGALSHSVSRSRYTKGFVEHGFVVGVYCIRQFHTYQQGVDRLWKRHKRTEFYDPVFATIGEQPVMKTQLYGSADEDIPFGYNEAWVEYRSLPSKISGQMRTGIADSLDVWHFGDYYSNAPTLGKEFVEETSDYVDRTITVPSSSMDQFILDFYVQNIAYRVMPTYSVPSLIDHH